MQYFKSDESPLLDYQWFFNQSIYFIVTELLDKWHTVDGGKGFFYEITVKGFNEYSTNALYGFSLSPVYLSILKSPYQKEENIFDFKISVGTIDDDVFEHWFYDNHIDIINEKKKEVKAYLDSLDYVDIVDLEHFCMKLGAKY